MRYPDPLRWELLGNPLGRWLVAVAVLAGVVAALYVVRRIVLRRLERFAARTATSVDDLVVHLVRRTKFFAIFAVALASAAYVLVVPERAHDVLRNVVVVAVAIQAALWGSEIVTFALARHAHRQDGTTDGATATTLTALGYMARGLLWVVILLVALATIGINVTALITGLGVGGVAIALAVQNILGDLFGALSIVLDKPFVVGDTIAVDQLVGTVEHIGLKTTRLRAVSGEQLIFSNADLLRSRIRNLKRQHERRALFTFTLAPDTPTEAVARVPAIVRATVEAVVDPAVRFDRAHFMRTLEAGFEFEVVYHVPTADFMAYLNAQQRINLELLRQFRELGIAFSAGTRTILVRGGSPDAPGDVLADAASSDGSRRPADATVGAAGAAVAATD
jgi:small-conductance mechanosensitive channel